MDARKPAAALLAAVFTGLIVVATGASYRTQNFVVEAPTSELAEEIGRMAEHYRHDLSIDWLGAALPNWAQPCPIHAQVAPQLGAGGATSFTFDHSEVFGWHMEIQGSHERLLDSVLPHEITHTIFASHFRRPLPRWADEGACTTVEDISERSKQDRMLIQFLHTGRGIAFSQMFAMTDYPQDILPLYAQGYSLARFLMDQKGKREFLTYIGEGMASDNWTAATNKYYGYKNLAVLQDSWLNWVKQGSPLRSPANRASGNVAVASKTGPEHNLIVRAQSADRAPAGNSGNSYGGETQWAPVARPAPAVAIAAQPTTTTSAVASATAPLRNGSVAMNATGSSASPANLVAPPTGKSVYGEGVGLIRHSTDYQSEATTTETQPPLPAPQPPAADLPLPRERKVLLEWSKQQ